jgi:hypothetical protein
MRGGGGDCLTFSRHVAQVQGTITWPRRRTEEPLNIDLLIKARKAVQFLANSVPHHFAGSVFRALRYRSEARFFVLKICTTFANLLSEVWFNLLLITFLYHISLEKLIMRLKSF